MPALMKRLLLILTFALCCTLFVMCKQATSKQSTPIIYNGLPFMQVTINGKPAWLLIDTGASLSVVDSAYAAANHDILIDTMQTNVAYFADIERFDKCANLHIAAGDIVIEHNFYVKDMSFIISKFNKFDDIPVVGILGCDYIAATGSIIDMHNKMFWIRQVSKHDMR